MKALKGNTSLILFNPWFSGNISETPFLFDQILTDFVDNVTTGFLSVDITDHSPIFLYFPVDIEKHINDKIKITYRDQKPERTSAFRMQ